MITDAMLDSHVAIIGTTGGGKSYTARGLVERLVRAERRVCILDPVGVWWGLRANAGGDGPGLPVAIFGGDNADVDIAESGAAALGRLIAEHNLASIIDTSEMGVGERIRFLTAFLGELYRVNRRALWVVMEEADEIAPQRAMPEATRLLDATDRIARRGRARGFRLIAISQRPAVIHKNVLTQIRTMIAHRLTAPQDTGAVMDWIRANADADQAKAVISSLPRLATGEAWVWAPEHGVLERETMPRTETFDSSRTPSADEEPLPPMTLAEIDLSELRQALEAEQPEPKKAPAAKASAAELEAAERRGWESGRAEAADQIAALSADLNRHRDMIGVLMRAASQFLNGALVPDEGIAAEIASEAPTAPKAAGGITPANGEDKPRPAPAPRPARANSAEGRPPSSARKILAVLDTQPPVRLTWAQACSLAGIRPSGGHFNSGRKWIRNSGQIIEDGDLIRIREPSAEAPALPDDPAERSRVMLENWRRIIGGPGARILDQLGARAGWHTKSAIADELGLRPTGGHWNGAWATLRRNNLIEEAGDAVRLAEWMRP